jgi:16S rRNA (cytosine1402-N4)-methyltransferase
MLAQSSASVPKAQVVNSAQARGAQASATAREVENRAARRAERDEAWRQRAVEKAAALVKGKELGAEADDPPHVPVLLTEALEALRVRDGGSYVDATFGAGGYSRALLSFGKATRVLALDRDPEAVLEGQALVERAAGRLTLVQARFAEIARMAHDLGFDSVDGVVFDIGVSSMQIDRPERGFSFRHDGPFDMRMSREGLSAADLVAASSAQSLADMLRFFGEEKYAGRVARAIVAARDEAPIRTTRELRRIIASAVPPARDGIDPATRTFQALRIAVNEELDELVRGLIGAASLLAPGGRLAVVAFHSLEDRIVKRFLQGRTGLERNVSRHLPTQSRSPPAFAPIGGPVTPGVAELARNPRARSARLRWGERGRSPLPAAISDLAELAALPRHGPAPRRRRK